MIEKEQKTSKEGLNFLRRKYPHLHDSPWIQYVISHYNSKNYSNNFFQSSSNRISWWMNHLECKHRRFRQKEELFKRLIELYEHKYAIKTEHIPDQFFFQQQQEFEQHDFQREERMNAESLILDQKHSLRPWIEYFLSSQSDYIPMWCKYWMFESLVKLSQYNQETKTFKRRRKDTMYRFPEFNIEAVSIVAKAIIEKIEGKRDISEISLSSQSSLEDNQEFQRRLQRENFGDLYGFAFWHVISLEKAIEKNHGKWVRFRRSNEEDLIKLVCSLEGKNTGWCTVGKNIANYQLSLGDFFVYYSYDDNGNPTIPRIAIRMEGEEIAEIRGIGKDQNLDREILLTNVLDKKLDEFGEKSFKHRKVLNDMKSVYFIKEKIEEGEDLSSEEMRFLYELDRKIECFGHKRDSTIDEILKRRDKKADLAKVFGCSPEEISLTESDALSGNIIFHYGDIYLYRFPFKKDVSLPRYIYGDLYIGDVHDLEKIKFPDRVGGNVDLSFINYLPKRFKFPKYIGGTLNIGNVNFLSKDISMPDYIGKNLDISSLTTISEGINFSEYIGGHLDLNRVRSIHKDVVFPKYIGGILYLSSLTELPEGFKFPLYVGGSLYLSSLLMFPKHFEFPSYIGGSLRLSSLLALPDGFNLPECMQGYIDLSSLEVLPDGFKLPEYVKGYVNLSGLTVLPEGFKFPRRIEGCLNLSKVKVILHEVLFPEYVEGTINLMNLESFENIKIPRGFKGRILVSSRCSLSCINNEEVRSFIRIC